MNICDEVQVLFEAKMQEFAAYCREHMQITDEDLENDPEIAKSGKQWVEGYNEAMAGGVDIALEAWLAGD